MSVSEKAKRLTKDYLESILKEVYDEEDCCPTILSILTVINEKILLLAASRASVREHPEYDLKRKMVYMGNQSVVEAIKSASEKPMFKLLEMIDREERKS